MLEKSDEDASAGGVYMAVGDEEEASVGGGVLAMERGDEKSYQRLLFVSKEGGRWWWCEAQVHRHHRIRHLHVSESINKHGGMPGRPKERRREETSDSSGS